MGMFEGVNQPDKMIHYAGKTDVCIYCLKKLSQHGRLSPIEATRELEGNLTGIKVVKFTLAGRPIIFCKECMKELLIELESEALHENKNVS